MSPNDATALAAWGQRGGAANAQYLNRYTYVLNSPVKSTDPTGHADVDPGNDQLRTVGGPAAPGGQSQGGSGGGGGGGGSVDDEDDRKQAGPQGDGSGGARSGGGGNGSSQAPSTTLPNPSAEAAKQAATKAPSATTAPQPPPGLVENPNRPGSYGKYENGKFVEYWRYDKAQPGAPGWRGRDHVHHYGGKDHLDPETPFDPNAPHPGKPS